MAEVQAAFNAADDDKDGLLSELEYLKFIANAKESAKEKGGWFPDYTEDMTKEMWRVFN